MGRRLRKSRSSDWSSKSSHSQLISDEHIAEFLEGCTFPSKPDKDDSHSNELIGEIAVETCSELQNILTVDGSYTTVTVNDNYPSSQIAFFQFGAILFTTDDLAELSEKPYIAPEDMRKLQKMERIKLAVPIKNMVSNKQSSLNDSIRRSIYEFFMKPVSGKLNFMETLSWLVYEEYSRAPLDKYVLSSNPNLDAAAGSVVLKKEDMSADYTFECDGEIIYLTDIFRLHEVIDEDFGAAGILGYISRLVEQLILIHYLRIVYVNQPHALDSFIFIANGPLSFSGQTANMHKVVRNLCNFLQGKIALNLVGIEKTGPFVDHALEICTREGSEFFLDSGSYLILSNEYIYRHVIPGDPSRMLYGETSYYGGKVIVHTEDGQVFVVTVPIANPEIIRAPKLENYNNLMAVIEVMKMLKCDLYADSIVPVALVNKLISLTSHPSQMILERFVKRSI